MLPLVGLTLLRTMPLSTLFGVLNGSLQIFGGVVRSRNGQIVAHLVNASDPLSIAANSIGSVAGIAINGVNTLQLRSLGLKLGDIKEDTSQIIEGVANIEEKLNVMKNMTSQIVALSMGTMALSGLTLAVSAAGFSFLSRKLNRIDTRLSEIQKDVHSIKAFLAMSERAKLVTALNTLQDIQFCANEATRTQLLTQSRQTLGELNHRFEQRFEEAVSSEYFMGVEEYYTVTAIAHALCAAELDMHSTAVADIRKAYDFWSRQCRSRAKNQLLSSNPEKLMSPRFADHARTDEIIDWLDFANNEERGLFWLDDLRRKQSRSWSKVLSRAEQFDIELLRRIASRNRVLLGYCAQYDFLAKDQIRPSTYQQFVKTLDNSQAVDGTFVLATSSLEKD